MPSLLAAAAGATLALTLTACAPGGAMPGPDPSTPSTSTPSGSTPSGSTPSGSTPSERPPFLTATPGPVPSAGAGGVPAEVPAARWDAIRGDLRDRGVSGEPALVSAEAVTWPNGALGCPRPGMSYTQALVDGLKVVVTADGATWDYRFGTRDTPLLCES